VVAVEGPHCRFRFNKKLQQSRSQTADCGSCSGYILFYLFIVSTIAINTARIVYPKLAYEIGNLRENIKNASRRFNEADKSTKSTRRLTYQIAICIHAATPTPRSSMNSQFLLFHFCRDSSKRVTARKREICAQFSPLLINSERAISLSLSFDKVC
jgi:hypothetical protein